MLSLSCERAIDFCRQFITINSLILANNSRATFFTSRA